MSLLFVTTATADISTKHLEKISDVLKYVESEHNPEALGDYNKQGIPTSYGILQIKQIVLDDVNKRYGTSYVHEEMFNINCAEEVFVLYIKMWSTHLVSCAKREVTEEDIVRIWNGGPHGYKKRATIKYLEKYRARKRKMTEPLNIYDFIPPLYLTTR
tara:strand:+ start:388 stop:861 length:474 start_codon:yes stop_codon:yes gene_type:complete